MTRAQTILSWLREREDEMAALLLELVSAESPSTGGFEPRALAPASRTSFARRTI